MKGNGQSFQAYYQMGFQQKNVCHRVDLSLDHGGLRRRPAGETAGKSSGLEPDLLGRGQKPKGQVSHRKAETIAQIKALDSIFQRVLNLRDQTTTGRK